MTSTLAWRDRDPQIVDRSAGDPRRYNHRHSLQPSRMALAAGTRLRQYEIIGPLGAGAMGEVYRGRDTRLHRDVAIKILPPQFAADAGRLARFEREAHILATLNHQNIAQIYG